MIRNIIFDWSGTLVDDLPAVWKATNFVFQKAGIGEFSLDRFRAEFCLPFKQFYDRYTSHLPIAQLEEWFHSRFREVQDEVVPLPHARDFLLLCRERRIRTFLLSAIHREHFATQAARTGFLGFIDRPYLEVADKRPKIRELMTENDLRADETLFIGDMRHDIETAKHGGVFSCAVLTGYTLPDELRASGPDVIVEHLGELKSLLLANDWKWPHALDGATTPTQRMPVSTVGALIFNAGGQVLMVRTRKWSNLWGIPGGKIQYGETSEDALRREIQEETALDITDIEFAIVQDCVHSGEFYRDAHFVLLNYTCRAISGTEVRLNEEAQEFRWVSLQESLEMKLNRPTRILIEAVLARDSRDSRATATPAKRRRKPASA